MSATTGGVRAAAFFDLDKTVIARSSSLAFSRAFRRAGLLTRRSELRSALAHVGYLLGADGTQQVERLGRVLTSLVTGWEVALVQRLVAETVHELIDPIVYAEALALIEEHRAAGRDVVIVSASGAEVVEPVGRLLGAAHVLATQLAVDDGRYTGEIESWVHGEAKAAAVRALADEVGYDLAASWAYSDSASDLPMLEAVGHPAVVNPDRAWRRTAVARGWPVLEFRRPVRLPRRRRRVVAAAVALVALVALAALVLPLRRGRR
nr:HAD family hydrolase [Motilibacter rhizosphaerae]